MRTSVSSGPSEAATLNTHDQLLSVEHVSVAYGGVQVLNDVSFTLGRRESLGIIGPNGAGKSTLLMVIAGEVKAGRGQTVLNGQRLPSGKAWRRARRGLVRTRQEVGLFRTMSVVENVRCGQDWFRRGQGRGQPGTSADELLEIFGIARWRDQPVGSLPYGIKKLTEVARALAVGPAILMLDEPVAGLNTAEKADMVTRLALALDRFDVGLLLVEHDMTTVAALCPDRTIALIAGQVAAVGAFKEVVATEAVMEAYLGLKGRR